MCNLPQVPHKHIAVGKKSGSESTCEEVCAYHEVTLQWAREYSFQRCSRVKVGGGHTCVPELVLPSELHPLRCTCYTGNVQILSVVENTEG